MSLDREIQKLLTQEDVNNVVKLRLPHKTALKKLAYISTQFDVSSNDSLNSFRKFNGVLKYDLSQRIPLFIDFYSSKGILEKQISSMFLKYPSIIGQNHEKKLRKRKTLGKLIGMGEEDIIKLHVSNPMSTGYGVDRNLAILRILQELDNEGFQIKPQQLRTYFSKSSPYVPNTNKLDIKQARRREELTQMPPMYEKLKKVSVRNYE